MQNLSFSKKYLLAAAVFTTLFSACRKDRDAAQEPEIPGKYDNGFFVVNEGYYGSGPGTLSFFDYATQTLTDSIYQKENPGREFSANTSSLQWAKFHNGKLYLLVKVDGDLIVLDQKTMQETGRLSGQDWRDFAAIDERTALVSTGNGIYTLNLEPLSLGAKLSGIEGEVTDLLVTDQYVFISAPGSVWALQKNGFAVAKKFDNMNTAPVRTDDGNVWAANDKTLYKIKPDLSMESIALGFSTRSNASFALSQLIAGGNDVYLAASSGFTGPNNKIYKYVQGNAASLSEPFIKAIPDNRMIYNRGLGYDKLKNQIDVTVIDSNYGEGNSLYVFDAASGNLVKAIEHPGFYFPSMPVYPN